MSRRILLASILSGLICAASASYVFISRPWLAMQQHTRWFEMRGAGGYQKNRRAMTARMASQALPGRVWFIGHSHIESLDVAQIDSRALGLGIGGETMTFMQQRLGDYDTLGAATAIVIAPGGNDVADATPAQMVSRAEALMLALPQNVPVVWSLILPADEKLQSSMTRAKISAANMAWKNICAMRARCSVSDATSALADSQGQLRADYHIGDGEHLNTAGNAVWATILKQDLAQLLQPKSPVQ
jgi:lysophospholipase L1-like esterase